MHGQARLRHLLDGHIASSREQAMREVAPHYEENMKMFGELRLVRALSDEQIAAMRDPRLAGTVKLPTIEDAVKAGRFLAGRPEDIIEQLKAVEKRYPGLGRRHQGAAVITKGDEHARPPA
jgi:hypothetical protein